MTPEDADHSRSPTASSSQLPSAHDHQAPPSKRSKHSPAAATRPNDGASTSTLTSTPPWAPTPTPQQLSSGRYTKLKPGEELLPQEEQDKILRRRLRDAERKRRDREKAQIAKNAAAAGAITGSAIQSDVEQPASIKGTPSSSTPSTPAASGALQAFAAAVIAEGRPTPSAQSHTPAETPRPSSSSSSSDELKAQAAAEKKAKAAADKRAAAERRAAAAAEKLAAERAALLAAEQEMQEEEEEVDDENEDDADQKLYCICRTLYDEERLMIACDLCDEWYHAACVPSMDDELAALVDVFVCPRCEPHTTECTTMKPPCLRQGCKMAARPPLSRYCSDRCGILVAAARIAKTKYAKSSSGGPKRLLTKQVQAASRKEGMVVWGEADAEGLQQWFASLSVRGADHGQEEVEDEDESKPIHPTSEPLSVGSSREEERLVDLRHHLSKLTAQRQEVSTTLDLAESRVKLLQLVDDRLGVLPPVMVEETASSSSSKKSKSKGGSKKDDAGAGLKTQPRCGYDERLAWDDERFSAWMASREGREMLAGSKKLDGHLVDADGQAVVLEDGGGADISSASATVAKVCGTAKRRCKRHADWNAVKTDDFEVEKDSQTSKLSTLSEEISRTNAQLLDLEGVLKAKRPVDETRTSGSIVDGQGGDLPVR